MSSALFASLTLRGVTLKNRIVVSPMCQYSCVGGLATDWHLVHLGSRAVGGAAAVMVEATAVEARGRISPEDMGLWSDGHAEPLARIARFVAEQGSIPAIQLAHAGRKASTYRPWAKGSGVVGVADGGWPHDVVAPSAIAYSASYPSPRALTLEEIRRTVEHFVLAAQRAVRAGFELVEIHSAHGYLLHEFLSPLSNHRTDAYGGSLENRMRLCLEVAAAVRSTLPATMPLSVRISASDWVDGGWDLDSSVVLCTELKRLGVDVIDVSSGGLDASQKLVLGPGYQIPFAAEIRRRVEMPVIAVGMITEPEQAHAIVTEGKADLVALARAFLRDPYWPLHAAEALGVDVEWPAQYLRAKPAR